MAVPLPKGCFDNAESVFSCFSDWQALLVWSSWDKECYASCGVGQSSTMKQKCVSCDFQMPPG